MTMQELAVEYRASAARLGVRMAELERLQKTETGAALDRVNHRLHDLCKLYRETMQTARELERYDR